MITFSVKVKTKIAVRLTTSTARTKISPVMNRKLPLSSDVSYECSLDPVISKLKTC